MRQYAILKNVVRDVNFGVVVKSDGNLKFFGWSEKAVEWASWANANNANLSQLPPNISVSEFKGMSDEVMKSIILSSEEATAAGSSAIQTKTIAFNAGAERYSHASKFPSFVDLPIPGDWLAKSKSINFKAHNFRKEVVQNELALRVRMHELAFNNQTKQFVSKPNRITSTHTRSEIQKKMSRGAERKFGKKIIEYTNKEILKNYVAPTIKRDVMGTSTKDILDVYTKARLGRAIGRAVGGAVRGMTPNRRTRGVASRFISGVLDPRKRRDVDGDGMIFDGTWREMPDPSRFIAKPGSGEGIPGSGMRSSGRRLTQAEEISRTLRETREAGQRMNQWAERPPSSRLRGMDLPGGGGVGIRDIDPKKNREIERGYRDEMDMRRRVSDDIAKVINELRDAGLTPERPKRGKRERRLAEGGSLRSQGVPNEGPRAAAAVQMAFDTRNSRKAKKMTYDPQTNSVEVTYNDGRTRRFDDVPYADARKAGADDAIDRLITDMETGRIGKESSEPIMGLRSSGGRRRRFEEDDDPYGDDGYDEARDAYETGDGPPVSGRQVRQQEADIENERGLRSRGMTTREMMRGQPRPKLEPLTPESRRRVDNAQRYLESGNIDNLAQLKKQIEAYDYRVSNNMNYLESLRDTLRRFGPSDKRRAETEKEFNRVQQEIAVDSAIRDLTKKRYDRIDKPGPMNKPGRGLRSSGNTAPVPNDPDDDTPSIENAVTKLASGDRMSVDELDYLDEVADQILDNPDTPEDIRDSMLDLKNSISARRGNNVDSLRAGGRSYPGVSRPIGERERQQKFEEQISKLVGADSSETKFKPKPQNPQKDKNGRAVNIFDEWESESIFKDLAILNRQIKQLQNWLWEDGRFPKSISEWYRDRDRADELLRELRERRRNALKSLKDRGYENPEQARLEYGRSRRSSARSQERPNPLDDFRWKLPRDTTLEKFSGELEMLMQSPSTRPLNIRRKKNEIRGQLEEFSNSSLGRRTLRSSGKRSGERLEDFGSQIDGSFKYPSKAQRKKIFDSKEDVDRFRDDLEDNYERARRDLAAALGFEDGYYMEDEELIERFMDDYGMSRGEARREMRLYRKNYDEYERLQEEHQKRLDELDEIRKTLPFEQELDDPIELDTNGFPKREDQMERFNELNELEDSPVFKKLKRKPRPQNEEPNENRDPEVEDLIANFPSRTAGPSEGSKRSLRSSGRTSQVEERIDTSVTEEIKNSYISMTTGGEDMDSGMRRVAATIDLNDKQTEKLSKIAYTLDRQRDDLPSDANAQKQLVDGIMEERFGNQPLSDEQRGVIREALTAFMAAVTEDRDFGKARKTPKDVEPSAIPQMVRRLQDGEALSPDELDTLEELADVVKNKPNVTEDEIVAMADLETAITKARRMPRRQFEPNQQALSSRGRTTDAPLSSRRSIATTSRAAQPRGTTLRSSGGGDGSTKPARTPVSKGKAGRATGAGPGGKAGHGRMTRTYGKDKKGDDGKVFESLTPEQQAAVKKALAEEVKPALDKKLKTFFSKYWTARTKRGSKKQSVVAVRRRAKGDERGRYGKVDEDTPLDSSDIYEMLYRLDGQVSEGLVEKFDVTDADSRDLKLNEDGQAQLSTARNGYTVQQRALDDAQTILNMIETGDFSALEHLHPSTKKKVADIIKKNGGTVPKNWINSESSIAGWAGGEARAKAPDAIDLEKERGIGKKKKEKRLSLFQRLRRVDPERERRVELRAARRQGRIREGIALDPELEIKRRVLRGRAMKRTFMSRFRKNRDPEALSTDMKSRKDEVSVLKTNPADGTVEVTDGYVGLLHALDQGLIGINEKKRKGASEEEIENEHKQLLRRLWENTGFSETPIQLKEDEVKALLDAGWQVMIRGTGAEKVNSESYVEQFISSEGRFIPGQGGSAYGIGEYFAYPGEWGGYHGRGGDDRHTIVALIPPSADVMMRRDIQREHSNLGNITTRISDAFKVFGGRDATKAMEPDELVAEIDKAVPDLAADNSRTGQIVKQLRDRMEALSKLPRNDDAQRAAVQEQKERILNSLDYLQRFSKQRSPEMIAPLIGVDVIDTNDGDGTGSPMLLHNRTNLAVFQVPTTHDNAIAMTSDSNGTRRPKVWTSWKRKAASAPERAEPKRRSPRRTRQAQATAPQPATPSAPTPTPNTPSSPTPPTTGKGAKAPVDVSSWTSSRPQSTGSNPATLLTAPDGTQYYTKLPKGTPDDKDRMETEALASELYKLAGIQSADVQMGTRNGQPVTLSRMVQSRMPNSQADQDEALKGYVVDAWLANWDAPLNDNIKIDSNGNAVRLDVGGSLDFRAQGARKGQAWGNTVGEIDSMKKSGTYDYKKITDAAIKQQAKALGNVTDADIRATVSRIVSDPARAKALADTLIARRDDIVKRYA